MHKSHRKKTLAKHPLYLSCMVLVVLSIMYMYFVSVSVLHVVLREELRQEAEKIKSDISNFETTYIAEQHKLNEMIIAQNGFFETKDKIFINRTTDSLVFSLGGE